MTLWNFLKGYCTICLIKVREQGKTGNSVSRSDCVRIGNTNICEYHLNELVKEFDRYAGNKS